MKNQITTIIVETMGLELTREFRKAASAADKIIDLFADVQRDGSSDVLQEWINGLSEQLADERNESDDLRTRIKRLQRYARSWEDDFRETMQGQHDEFVEATIKQMRDESLEPSDLENDE